MSFLSCQGSEKPTNNLPIINPTILASNRERRKEMDQYLENNIITSSQNKRKSRKYKGPQLQGEKIKPIKKAITICVSRFQL